MKCLLISVHSEEGLEPNGCALINLTNSQFPGLVFSLRQLQLQVDAEVCKRQYTHSYPQVSVLFSDTVWLAHYSGNEYHQANMLLQNLMDSLEETDHGSQILDIPPDDYDTLLSLNTETTARLFITSKYFWIRCQFDESGEISSYEVPHDLLVGF
jgi:hypothetical protein